MLKFALAGNPNCGKTTLFNALTGSTAHVGNWPGVTVDKREGVYKKGETPVTIVDLPGIYSLSPYTPEEVVARNFLLNERPDCIVNIVDATNLERNLYLTTQLMELDAPVVVALNMTDVLDKNGDRIDVRTLEKRLGLPVVEISALKGENIGGLMTRALNAVKTPREGVSVLKDSLLWNAIERAESALRAKEMSAPLFHAVKLVERDGIEVRLHPVEAGAAQAFIRTIAAQNGKEIDVEAEIADARYKYVTAYFSPTLTRAKKSENGGLSYSNKADKVLTHKWAGIPIFLIILFAIFHITFSEDFLCLGALIGPFGEWCEAQSESVWKGIFFSDGLHSPGVILFRLTNALTARLGETLVLFVRAFGASDWAVGFIEDGVLRGVLSVLSFLPQILVLFLLFSVLEDTGYMARVAFMLDRIFRRFGVSGRAFMPMIMGFGCSVPAMINTRTLADEKEREATVRVIPFFSCGAKMPVLLAVSGAIAQISTVGSADIITYSMYILGVLTALLSLLIMRNTVSRGETSPFIMELPVYHKPGLKNLALHLWDKAKHFVQKAFTVIVASSVVVWFLSNFRWDWQFTGSMQDCILSSLGRFIQPVFTPLGFGSQLGEWGWVFAVSAIAGLIAKEDVIATFGVLAACIGLTVPEGMEEGVGEVVCMIQATGIGIPALVAFIAFNMLTVPCFAAMATARGELGKDKFKRTLFFWLAVSFLVGTMIYTVGTWLWTVAIWAAAAAFAVVGIVWYHRRVDGKARVCRDKKSKACCGCDGCAV